MKRLTLGQFVVEWVARRTNEFGNFGAAQGIGLQQLIPGVGWGTIAGVAYAEFNGPNVVCHIAAVGRQWATREYLWTIFDYPFNQLKCSRITVCIGEGNKDSRRFVEHLGFTQEANLQGAHPTGDLVVYRMLRSECRFLENSYAKFRPDLVRSAA